MLEDVLMAYGLLILGLLALFAACIAISIYKDSRAKKKPQNEVFISDEWSELK